MAITVSMLSDFTVSIGRQIERGKELLVKARRVAGGGRQYFHRCLSPQY